MDDGFDWHRHGASLVEATGQTLYMVSATLVIGGLLGLVVAFAAIWRGSVDALWRASLPAVRRGQGWQPSVSRSATGPRSGCR